ncbi:MAG: hypothetical protein KF760_33240 [Candidatus Eremiobacteraeota bacterium]|nr:hypothetical protein [Candidatus Eremiobacteraeota bacterium]MCW5869071.1 hypothetical protein [Candidatus Eremiobacteraeota bacterium]
MAISSLGFRPAGSVSTPKAPVFQAPLIGASDRSELRGIVTTEALSGARPAVSSPFQAATLTRQQAAVASTLSAGAADPRQAARDSYGLHGNESYDLSKPAQVNELIRHSPQVDDLKDTKNDEVRCGGASLFNALLADGSPRENADALQRSASQEGVEITPAQQDALDSMRQSSLTPRQSAQLQELSYNVADQTDGKSHPGEGLNSQETDNALLTLKENNGFPNSRSVSITSENVGTRTRKDSEDNEYVNHATSTTITKDGRVVTADSNPSEDGLARVGESASDVLPTSSPRFAGRTTLVQGPGGTAVVRQDAVDEAGRGAFSDQGLGQTEAVQRRVVSVDQNGQPRPEEVDFLDPKTGQPLPADKQKEISDSIQSTARLDREEAASQSGVADQMTQRAQENGLGAGPADQSTGRAEGSAEQPAPSSEVTQQPAPAPPASESLVDKARKLLPSRVKLAGVEAGVGGAVVSKEASYQGKHVQAAARVEVLSAQAGVGASVGANLRQGVIQAEVHAGVSVNLATAEAQARVGIGIGSVGGQAQARVGADATGSVGIGINPAKGDIGVGAGAAAFAGARAGVGLNANVGPVGVKANYGVQAGVGAHAAGEVGLKDGKLSVGFDVGISLGIGIRLKLGVSVDFKKIGKLVGGAVKSLKNLGKSALNAGKKAVKWLGNGAKKAAKAVGKAVKKVGKAVGKAAKKVGKAVGKAAKKVGRSVKKAIKKLKFW